MPALPHCLLLLPLLAAHVPEQGPAPRHVDRYGDPLPAGAIQRFGWVGGSGVAGGEL